MSKRFASVSEQDILNLQRNKNAKSTDYNTKTAMQVFSDYCQSEHLDYLQMTKPQLDETLSIYFMAARKTDGQKYQYQTLQQMRYSLNRFLKIQ